MSFLYPLFLAGAAAIAIPIVLHLLRRDVAPEVPFTAVRLLRRSPLEQTRRRRLRDLLLLAARVAALILLAAAFARPYVAGAAADSPLQVVAIDRSFSMGVPGRFERALEMAREAIDGAGRGARIAVVAFDDRADVLAAPGSAGQARAALAGLRPSFGATRYAPMLMRAAELAELGPARVIVVSDMQRAGWEDEEPVALPANLEIETRAVGVTSANAGVTAVRREPAAVVATIRNGGSSTVAGQVRVMVEGRPAASAPFFAPGGVTIEVPIRYRSPDRGLIAVEIDDPGGYLADNTRYALLDPAGRNRVLAVVGDDGVSGFYLSRALQAADSDAAFDLRVRPAASLGAITAADMAANRAVLLLSTRNLDRRARDMLIAFVREGGGLFVAAAADVEPDVLATVMQWKDFSAVEQAADGAVLAATDLRHPIFRAFGPLAANLGQVRFSRAWHVRTEGWDVAARFTDGSPALLERREGKGRVLVFASDFDRRWNDFPLHPAFVPFAQEAVRHITSGPEGRRDYAIADAPRGARPEPGAYTLPGDGRQVTVNVDARETSASRISAEEFTAMVQRSDRQLVAPVERRAQQLEGRQNLWRYGLLLMLVALAGESVAGRTR